MWSMVSADVTKKINEPASTVNAAKLWFRHTAEVHHSGTATKTEYDAVTPNPTPAPTPAPTRAAAPRTAPRRYQNARDG